MRRLLAALGLIAAISDAFAGELALPTLRGSNNLVPETPAYLRWSGFYAGGQVGMGIANADFANATQGLIEFALRDLALENEAHPSAWQVLGKTDTRGSSVGAFVGYNSRFDDVILGLDFNYSRTSFTAGAPSFPIARLTTAGGIGYAVELTGSASLHVTDLATLRARAGYAVGSVLPYFTVGLAAARADFSRSATVFAAQNPPTGYPSVPCDPQAGCTEIFRSNSETKNGTFIYGWSIGGGLDMLVLPNVFVRAEYEYVGFGNVGDIKAAIGTGRLGVGVKF